MGKKGRGISRNRWYSHLAVECSSFTFRWNSELFIPSHPSTCYNTQAGLLGRATGVVVPGGRLGGWRWWLPTSVTPFPGYRLIPHSPRHNMGRAPAPEFLLPAHVYLGHHSKEQLPRPFSCLYILLLGCPGSCCPLWGLPTLSGMELGGARNLQSSLCRGHAASVWPCPIPFPGESGSM